MKVRMARNERESKTAVGGRTGASRDLREKQYVSTKADSRERRGRSAPYLRMIIIYDRLQQKVLKIGIYQFSVGDAVEFLMFFLLSNQQKSWELVVKWRSCALSCLGSGVLLTLLLVGCVLRKTRPKFFNVFFRRNVERRLGRPRTDFPVGTFLQGFCN